jgi:hypothetical protein
MRHNGSPLEGKDSNPIGPAVKARVTRVFHDATCCTALPTPAGGWENVMHASHQRIRARARCGVFYVEAVRRLMAPAGIDGGDEAVRNGAAQDDLFTARRFSEDLAFRFRTGSVSGTDPMFFRQISLFPIAQFIENLSAHPFPRFRGQDRSFDRLGQRRHQHGRMLCQRCLHLDRIDVKPPRLHNGDLVGICSLETPAAFCYLNRSQPT